MALASLVGLAFAWGAVRAAVIAQSSAPQPPPAAPTPTALFDVPQVSPEEAAPGSDRQRDPSNPDAPAISFIDSPSATCYLPRPGTDACYITWNYLNVSASTSQYIISMTVNIDNHMSAYIAGFFQTAMYVPGDIFGKGFRVACGTPGSGSVPNYGKQYQYTIRARETGGLKAANYGSVTCPSDQVPLASLELSGPATGITDTGYTFFANAFPITATQPITYVWIATGSPPITTTGGITAAQSFSWSSLGDKIIQVTASNSVSSLTQTATITIEPTLVPITSVSLNGRSRGYLNAENGFTATVHPANASPPFTYTWEVDGYPAITQTNGGTNAQGFSWASNGSKSVKVTVSNPVNSLVQSMNILIEPYRVYFPLQAR